MSSLTRLKVHAAACLALAVTFASFRTASAVYVAKRLVTGLNQPDSIAAAPGDNDNLYIVERAGAGGTLGDIVRYNKTTGTTTAFLNVSGSLVQDGGLLSLTFHPDFQTNGLFYVTSLVGSTNMLEEYKVPSGGGTPTKTRTLLQYDNPRTQHTIDWVGFKPGATGDERNYLYLTTGDGGIQADEAGFTNRGQDATLDFGKVLRLDVNPSAPDAYPSDPNKNFAIPAGNPFVNDNTGKLKEVFATGFRNPWRASFDRTTGDLYVGDVGFNSQEEVNFLKNDANFSSGKDFGWARREGVGPNPVAAFAGPQGGSVNPILDVPHPDFTSITGGFVYRGPIAQLYGKYLFGDFVSSKIYAINFDRDTDPNTFDGVTAGISNFQDLTPTINALIALNGGGGPISGLVSFGEDNDGNLYIVSMGTGNIFNPTLGTGSIFVLNAIPEPAALLPVVASLALLRRPARCRCRRS